MANLQEFDKLRQNADSDLNASRQQNDDALKRRFAAMGGLNSGSFIKQQQVSDDNMSKQKQSAMNTIGVQEAQEGQRRQELGDARAFQTSERIGGQDFAHGEAGLARNQQGAQFNQTLALQGRGMDLQQKAQQEEKDQKDRALGLEADAQQFNASMARKEFENPGGLLQGITGKGGLGGMVGGLFGGGSSAGASINSGLIPGLSGGSFFCTEMHEKGVIAAHSLNKVSRLIEVVLFSRPEQLEYYYQVAPEIIAVAKLRRFDWTEMQNALVHEINILLDKGHGSLAREFYLKGIRDMCLKFEETAHLWDEEIRETSIAKSAGAFLRLARRPKIRALIFNKLIGGLKWQTSTRQNQARA